MRAQQHLDKNKLLKTNENTFYFSSYLAFSITWILKLNIAFLYLSDGKRETLKFCFEWKEPNKNGAKFSTNHWLGFKTSIRSYIDISKTIEMKLTIVILKSVWAFFYILTGYFLTNLSSSNSKEYAMRIALKIAASEILQISNISDTLWFHNI